MILLFILVFDKIELKLESLYEISIIFVYKFT